MGSSTTIIYDGTFNGFLTLIYKAFEKKWALQHIQKKGFVLNELFTHDHIIETDIELAKKVWSGIGQRNHAATKRIYYAFLSEHGQVELHLYHYIRFVMDMPLPDVDFKQTQETLDVLVNKVEKEKRRMEAFAQFQLTKDHGEVAHISPKYNVLPLLTKHLRQSNKGREWQVFDDKRKFGVRYSAMGLELISQASQVLTAV
nr:TIGR03915 family putative DNA repair protein [Allomuricauda sp.]